MKGEFVGLLCTTKAQSDSHLFYNINKSVSVEKYNFISVTGIYKAKLQ